MTIISITNCGYAYTNGSLEDTNFSDIHMHAEQFHKLVSTQDYVFENSKWKIYYDSKYLETTHFEGSPNSAREILIQSRNRLKEEEKANSVTTSSSQGVMISDSSAINYKPVQLINDGSIDVFIGKTIQDVPHSY